MVNVCNKAQRPALTRHTDLDHLILSHACLLHLGQILHAKQYKNALQEVFTSLLFVLQLSSGQANVVHEAIVINEI